MTVVIDQNVADEQIENVHKRVQELGLKAHNIRGTERTVNAGGGDGGFQRKVSTGVLIEKSVKFQIRLSFESLF